MLISLQFLFRSSGNNILSRIDLLMAYFVITANRFYGISDLFLVVMLLFIGDLVSYQSLGLSSMIFFTAYSIMIIIEKYIPTITKGTDLVGNAIFFLLIMLSEAAFMRELSFFSVAVNFLVLLIMRIFVHQDKSRYEY